MLKFTLLVFTYIYYEYSLWKVDSKEKKSWNFYKLWQRPVQKKVNKTTKSPDYLTTETS